MKMAPTRPAGFRVGAQSNAFNEAFTSTQSRLSLFVPASVDGAPPVRFRIDASSLLDQMLAGMLAMVAITGGLGMLTFAVTLAAIVYFASRSRWWDRQI
jgi:hypothetical protein